MLKNKKSIVVTAFRSSMGKTTLVCRFLKNFPHWAAVKIITYHTHKMPEELSDKGFDIITQTPIISKKNTDTGKMWEIIGDNVFWVRTQPEKQSEAFEELLRKIQGYDTVIIEGTSILSFHKPDKAIMLIDDGDKKLSANKNLNKIDIFLPGINFYDSPKKSGMVSPLKSRYLDLKWNTNKGFNQLIKFLEL